jgi:hypothetical protein
VAFADAFLSCFAQGFRLGAKEAIGQSQFGSGSGVILIDELVQSKDLCLLPECEKNRLFT